MTKRRIMQIQRALFVVFALCAAAGLSPRACAQTTWSTIDQGGGYVFSTSYVEVDTSDYDAGAGVIAEILDPDGNVVDSNSQFMVTPDCDGGGGEWAEVDLYTEAGLPGWYSVYATYWELGFPDIAEGDWTYLGDETEWTYTGGAGLGISFLGQTSVDYGQGGSLQIYGSGFAPNGTPNVAWISFGTSFIVASDSEIDVPINPATPIGLYIILVLIENGESTNSQTFSVTGDQTPSGISVSPSPWVAGSQIEIQITGLNFGTNQPQVSFSCGIGTCLDNTFSPDFWSDTLITGMVDVDPGAAGQTVTVTVGSTGFSGLSFVPGSGQTSQGSTTVPVVAPTLTQSPAAFNMSVGQTNSYITSSISPRGINFTPFFSSALNGQYGNPNSNCQAQLTFASNSGVGSVTDQVTASNAPGGTYCSGVFDVLGYYGASVSTTPTTIYIPPQMIGIQMYSETYMGQYDGISNIPELSVATAAQNRFSQSGFTTNGVAMTNWQTLSQVAQCCTPAPGQEPELDNAVQVFTGALGDIVGGAACYWSPSNAEYAILQSALSTGSTSYPSGLSDPKCFTYGSNPFGSTTQVVLKASMPPNIRTDVGGYNLAPAFAFEGQRSPGAPFVVTVP